ncbi:PilN domain-containing protein [Flavobacterium sp. RHBU_24]|uniref:PilN domain-containing protein n=1 Tax=Flavobacterium sp. RHBU_24 TaxID=3391185 RepID=UPI003984BF66
MIINKLFQINALTVLGIFRDTNDTDSTFSTLQVVKRKDKLIVIAKNVFPTFEAAIKGIDIKNPVIVVFDGKGVLNKKIDNKSEQDIAWKNNIDLNTIYLTTYLTDGVEFISFARKTFIDEFLNTLAKNKVEIIDLHIGPLAAVVMKNVLGKNSYISNTTLLEFTDDKLVHLEKVLPGDLLPHYNISELELSSSQLLLYSCAVKYYIEVPEIEKSVPASINAEEVVYKKAFNKLAIVMLAFVFTLLIISYSCIQYYLSKNAALNEQNLYSTRTFNEIQKMDTERQQKLKILADTGQMSKNFMSFYIYTIAKSVPAEIILSSLEISPLSTDIKEGKKIEVNANTILIFGISKDDRSFNSWMEKVKKNSWIGTFEILSIKKNKDNKQEFEIKIHLNDV